MVVAAVMVSVGGCDAEVLPTLDASLRDASSPALDAPEPVACAGGCIIDGTCFADGAPDPSNACQACDVDVSTTGFSPDDGARCDDGTFCTIEDTCSAGACVGTTRSCDDGIPCNGVEACDATEDACAAGTSACTEEQICDAVGGGCVLECAGCSIGGTCYGDGQVDPLNPCQVCDASASRDAWTANDGARCDDEDLCTTGDSCAAGACVGGTARACDDGVACDGAETCNGATGECVVGATTCAADQLCDITSDACVATCTGCVIGGVCFGAGQRSPTSQCEVCDPMASRTAWSANDGATCDDGLFCTRADVCVGAVCGGTSADFCGDGTSCNGVEACDEAADRCIAGTPSCTGGEVCDVATDRCLTTCSGCVIAGVCHAPDARNPANPCEICDVADSTTAWSANVGASCDDGLFCTAIDRCTDGAACVGAARSCSDDVDCNGVETCNETADRCDPGTPTCVGGTACDPVADSCTVTCASGTSECSSMCVDTSRDDANCGACGTSCERANAIGDCAASACRFACLPGFGDCDRAGANGCEVALSTVANCGACGNACVGDQTCSAGVCVAPSRVTGVVFDDLDTDGVRDAGEPGITGRVVFLDANLNRVLDAGERSATSDATGAYAITNVPPGSYTVREVQTRAYLETFPGIFQRSSDDFSAATVGAMWAATGDGISQSGGELRVSRNDVSDAIRLARTIGTRFEISVRVRLDFINWNDTFHGFAISGACESGNSGFDFGFSQYGNFYGSTRSCGGAGFGYSPSQSAGRWYTVTISGLGGAAIVTLDGATVRTPTYPPTSALAFSMPGYYSDGDGPAGSGQSQTAWDDFVIRDAQPGGHAIVVTEGVSFPNLHFGND